MDEDEIRKYLIIDMIIDKMFDCLEIDCLENKKIVFDRYNLNDKEMLYLLKKYDEKRFMMYEETLKQGEEIEND